MVHAIERHAVIISEEVSRGYVSHAVAIDETGGQFLCIGKADDANPNLRWVDIYYRPDESVAFANPPLDRLDPTYKIDAVDADVDRTDLIVTVTTHAPREAPRPTAVEEIRLLGVAHTRPQGQRPGACVPPGNLPYFLPNNTVTRGQVAKMIAIAVGLPDAADGTQSFQDIPANSPFYKWIEAMHQAGAIGGYPCV